MSKNKFKLGDIVVHKALRSRDMVVTEEIGDDGKVRCVYYLESKDEFTDILVKDYLLQYAN